MNGKKQFISHVVLIWVSMGLCIGSDKPDWIKGTVVDQTTGYAIEGVVVMKDGSEVTGTDSGGRFSLVITDRVVQLTFVKDGYGVFSDRYAFKPSGNTGIVVELIPLARFEDRMLITASPVPEVEPVEFITPEYIVDAPGAFEDTLQSLQAMPGVVAGSDFSARLYVRGGRPDQNGIFMDGIPIYDPYRLFGLTSLFNPETIQDVKLIPGGFDVQYGDRLSAVIDVTNRHGSINRVFSGSANISLTNANLVAEGRLLSDIPSSWLVSARRTYYDIILNQVDDSSSSYPSFTDIQGLFYIEPDPYNQWFLTLLACDEGTDLTSENESIEGADPDRFDALDDQKNYISGLNGSHLLTDSMRLSYTVSWTENRQRSSIDFTEGETQFNTQASQNLVNDNAACQADLAWYLDRHSLHLGASYARSANRVTFNIDTEDPRVEIPDSLLAFNTSQDFDKYGAYIQDSWEVTSDLEWKLGFRWDRSNLSGMSAWSPRSSLWWHASDSWHVRWSGGFYYQFPSYESLQGDGYFLDLRGIRDLNLKPERSIHSIIGVEYNNPAGWSVDAGIYYKKIDDLLDTTEETETVLILDENDQTEWYNRETPTFIPRNMRQGYSRGIDLTFELQDSPGRPVYGMIGYTFGQTRSRKTGQAYAWDSWDLRHHLTFIGGWVISKRWEIGWKWLFSSGFPYTPVTKLIRVVEDLDEDGSYEPDDGETFTYQRDDPDSAIRSRRLPVYHRLDCRIQYARQYRSMDAVFYLDIINLYARENVQDYYYNADYSRRYEDTGIPFLPSLGAKLKF